MKAATGTLVLIILFLIGAAAGAEPPGGRDGGPLEEARDLVNALLGGLLGGREVTGEQLQDEVAEAGGLPFRREVPVAFLGRGEFAAYLREAFDEDYPAAEAQADERLLGALDLLPPGTDLRALRARLLEDNVAGFYDERPDRRRLYAVSEDRTFSPLNQIVLVHELRHALQDQYAELDSALAKDLSDYDDRRMAFVSLLEGDATLVMERFVSLRLGAAGLAAVTAAGGAAPDAPGGSGLLDVPGAPPVVRDQLVQPYLAGLVFARAIWQRGGARAMREAWRRPPESSEQVLHPAKYFAGEKPRSVAPSVAAPREARALAEGVLGELFIRTLLEEGAEEAAAGWGGDGWRLWDAGGRTAFAWRTEWDRPQDADEFHAALRARFSRGARSGLRSGWELFSRADGRRFAVRRSGDAVELRSAEDEGLLDALIAG